MSKNSQNFYYKVEEKLSSEERNYIRQNLENKSCTTCTNSRCTVSNFDKTGLDEYGKLPGANCLGWNNPELIGKSKVLKLHDITRLK